MEQKAVAGPTFARQNHNHDQCVRQAIKRAEELCLGRGRRLTALRRQVLELVWDNHQPVGAYEILEKMSDGVDRVAPATVYRALDFLREQGLVHRLASLNAFIGCSFPGAPHTGQFLICTSCRELAELDDSRVDEALHASAGAAGFAISRSTVEIMGLCPLCRKAQS